MTAGFATALCALLSLHNDDYRAIVATTVLFAAFGISIGIVQISTGGTFPRIYDVADHTALIGLYANKNHMGLAMATSIPLMHLLLSDRDAAWSSPRQLSFYGYWTLVLLALPLTNSRAGIIFGLLASAAIAWSVLAARSWKLSVAAGGLFAALAVVFAASPLPQSLLARFATVAEDNRWEIFSRSASLLEPYKFFGSGLGSFRDVFMTVEKIEWVGPLYINNVHNDYLQIIIEMGLMGGVAVVALAGSVTVAALKLRSTADREAKKTAWACFIVVALFALHSFVDYPLRRPAAVAIFLVSLAGVMRVYRPLQDCTDSQSSQ
jgi:O-antigen ligase